MPYVTTPVAAAELVPLTFGVPFLMGTSLLESYQVQPEWRVSGSWASGTNIADPTRSTLWGFDRRGHLGTGSTSINGQTEVSYICDLVEGTDAAHTLDTVFIWNHTFRLLGTNTRITLEIADSSDFVTNNRVLATWDDPDDRPLLAFHLNGLGMDIDRRYTNVRYLRLRLRKTSGTFGANLPTFGELWCGRRRQLWYFPDVPIDFRSESADVVDFESKSGNRTRYVRSRGRRRFNLVLRSGGVAEQVNQEQTLRDWFSDCYEGSRPSVFVIDTDDSARTPHVVFPDPPELFVNALGPNERECSLSLVECAPFVVRAGDGSN
jgi:hypothetical protein